MPDTEKLGQAIDRVDNLYHGLMIPIPNQMHVEQLKRILPEIIKELKDGFREVTGEDPWEFE